jgi:DNA-binding XRE family transcriptional regulator
VTIIKSLTSLAKTAMEILASLSLTPGASEKCAKTTNLSTSPSIFFNSMKAPSHFYRRSHPTMFQTYLEQLTQIAVETGWSLNDACDDSGISRTTLYRWQKGTSHPSEGVARKIADHMQRYARPEA